MHEPRAVLGNGEKRLLYKVYKNFKFLIDQNFPLLLKDLIIVIDED